MSAVLTIARASVTEHMRRKLVLFFAGIAVILAAGLTYLAVNRGSEAAIPDALFGLGAVAASVTLLPLIVTLAAVALSMNNIGRPFSDGEAMLILARPVARRQYAAGRLMASVGVVLGLCLFSALLMQGVSLVSTGDFVPALWGHWATIGFNLTVLVALTTLLSSIVNAPVLAAFIAYFTYALSGVFSGLQGLVNGSQVKGMTAAVVTVGYYLTPRKLESPLVTRQEVVGTVSGSEGQTATWAVVYLMIVLVLTFVLVERKDL